MNNTVSIFQQLQEKKLLKFYLANVIILMIPKTSSSPMNAAWIAAKMTSTRSTYVCHKMRYSVPSTAGILSTIDTNTPIIRSVRFPFCAEMYNFFQKWKYYVGIFILFIIHIMSFHFFSIDRSRERERERETWDILISILVQCTCILILSCFALSETGGCLNEEYCFSKKEKRHRTWPRVFQQ